MRIATNRCHMTAIPIKFQDNKCRTETRSEHCQIGENTSLVAYAPVCHPLFRVRRCSITRTTIVHSGNDLHGSISRHGQEDSSLAFELLVHGAPIPQIARL